MDGGMSVDRWRDVDGWRRDGFGWIDEGLRG